MRKKRSFADNVERLLLFCVTASVTFIALIDQSTTYDYRSSEENYDQGNLEKF
jgi:hypothetical protein